MSSDKTRARVHWVLNRRLVRLNAAGETNPAHVASLFKARWKMSRHIEMLRRRWHAKAGGGDA